MRRSLAAFALAALAAAGLLTAAAPRALADEPSGVAQTAATTVRLDPARNRLNVSITIRVLNATPDGLETYSCTKYTGGWWSFPYTTTCRRAVRYYVEGTTALVDAAAANLKAVSGKKALEVSVGEPVDGVRQASMSFPRLFKGKRRTIVLSYTVPGGEPRSEAHTRTLRAFARFCVVANGSTSGTVTVRLPKRYATSTTGSKVTASVVKAERVFASGTIEATDGWRTCFTGTNAGAYRTERLAGPGGSTIRLRSWPEDNDWADGVRDDVASSLPRLERLTGIAPAAKGPIDIRETGGGTPYAGSFDGATNTITVGEDFGEPALVEHELAHAWFNLSVFDAPWLAEGYAEWAGRSVAGEDRCDTPDDSAAHVDLASWGRLAADATDDERAALAAQYLAACHLVSAVADAAGPERMTTATIALLGRRDPYAVDGGGSGTRKAAVASWRDWLDAVDELALDPAGAPDGFAADLLARYGVATDADLLAARAEARHAYRALAASVGWTVPSAVRAPLAEWRFGAASKAIAAAAGTWEATGETDAILPEADARNGVVADTWQRAGSVADLRSAATLADRQLTAARDVASARAALDEPLDLVQRVGQFATDIPGLDDAILAVRSGDVDAAAEAAGRIRASVAGLRAAGEGRLAFGGVLVLTLTAVLTVLAVRRTIAERARRAEARASASVVAVGTAEAWRAAPAGDGGDRRFDPNPLDESPTQPWVPPPLLVIPSVEGDPDLAEVAKLVRRPPDG